jgi:N-acetylglucosamine-6-phosphate deacetylase
MQRGGRVEESPDVTPALLTNARLITPDGVVDDGWVEIAGADIARIGTGERAGGTDLHGMYLSPGFVDLHVHGGAGAAFQSGDPEASRSVTALHLRHGTTTLLAGLSASPLPQLERAARSLVGLVEDGLLAGIFYEGPYLSDVRRGAQDPRALRVPARAELQRLLRAGAGTVRMMTIAPELPGALGVIRDVVDAGAVAAVGHTDASYEQTCAAFAAGARVATHMFNGMRPIHHRDPGPVVAALEDDRVVCELVSDGFHLHDATLKLAFGCAGPGRIALVTDAIEATGVGDGRYALGDMAIDVVDGMAQLADGSSIAGSTLTTDKALRRAVLSAGIPLHEAVTALTATPARVLGLEDRIGVLAAGARADLVVLDEALAVVRVYRAGQLVP